MCGTRRGIHGIQKDACKYVRPRKLAQHDCQPQASHYKIRCTAGAPSRLLNSLASAHSHQGDPPLRSNYRFSSCNANLCQPQSFVAHP